MVAPQPPESVRRSSSPPADFLDDVNDYTPYVPLKQRKEALLAKYHSGSITIAAEKKREQEEQEEEERKKKRSEKTLLLEAQEVKRLKAFAG